MVTLWVDDCPISAVPKSSEAGITENSDELGDWLPPLSGILIGLGVLSALWVIFNVSEDVPPVEGEKRMVIVFDSPGARLKGSMLLTIENLLLVKVILPSRRRLTLNELVMVICLLMELLAST